MEIQDKQLIQQYLNKGDEMALETLVERYLPQIYGYIRNFTGNPENASDITQEVFVKAWKNLNRFDQSKAFDTWLFTIAKRTAIDWMRRRTEDRLPDEIADIPKEQNLALAYAQLKLSPENKEIIELHLDDNMTFREIAEKLQKPLNTIKSSYRRSLALLKSHLEGKI